MIGLHMITEKNRATLNRMVKPPSTVVTTSVAPRMAASIWPIMSSMSAGVAK